MVVLKLAAGDFNRVMLQRNFSADNKPEWITSCPCFASVFGIYYQNEASDEWSQTDNTIMLLWSALPVNK